MIKPAPLVQDLATIPRKDAPGRPNLVGMTRGALAEALAGVGVPERQVKMRTGQVWAWIYQKGARSFDEMTNVSKDLRATLAEHFEITRPEIVTRQVSEDGTRKYLLRVGGGHEVEAVYIPEEDRGTLCISSQIGCTLTCSFCHTGTQKLVRNLTAGEIVGQILVARDDLGEWDTPPGDKRLLSNIVLMGMGEPLYNTDNVRDAMKIAMDGEGISLSRRRITLSTSGIVPEIARAGEEIGCMLAISFHATTDEVRDTLVPINRKWKIADLLQACRDYPRLSNAERITFEYVMLKGVNDSDADALAAGQADRGHSGQDQSDPVQSVARRTLRAVGLGPDRGVCRHREPGGLCLAGAHAPRRGYHGRLRSAEIRHGTGPQVRSRNRRRGGLTPRARERTLTLDANCPLLPGI